MSLPAMLLVLLAAFLHASWNAAAKSSRDPLVTVGLIACVGGVLGVLFAPFFPFPERAAWPYLAGSMVLHLGYQWFLASAYKWGDLSQVYPIARGTAPCLLAMMAAIFAGEVLTPLAIGGLALVTICLCSLAGSALGNTKAVRLALVTAAFIAAYSFVDGQGARLSGNVWGFVAWLNIFDTLPIALTVVWVKRKTLRASISENLKVGLVSGFIGSVAYAIVIWAMVSNPMANVSSLRETSVLFAGLIGWIFLGETFGRARILATLGVVVGLVLLQLA